VVEVKDTPIVKLISFNTKWCFFCTTPRCVYIPTLGTFG